MERITVVQQNFLCNKKYVLSNSESVQCNFFIFDHVTFIQFKIMLLCTKFHRNRMIFRWDMALIMFLALFLVRFFL